MNTKYTIYLGRFKAAEFQADDIRIATTRFDSFCEKTENIKTCTLYQGDRSMENMCIQLKIKN
jgi:hypothetical protein